MLFLSVRRDGRRWVEHVWESDGQQPHRLLYAVGNGGLIEPSHLVVDTQLAAAGRVIDKLLSSGMRTIEDVRAMILQLGQT